MPTTTWLYVVLLLEPASRSLRDAVDQSSSKDLPSSQWTAFRQVPGVSRRFVIGFGLSVETLTYIRDRNMLIARVEDGDVALFWFVGTCV